MSGSIHVSNIPHSTTENELRDFFSYCGRIQSLSLTPASGAPDSLLSATITFERKEAANTALLLDHTAIHGGRINVEVAPSIDNLAGEKAVSHADEPKFGAEDDPLYRGEGLRQEDKPRAAILAEILGAGYAVGDTALQKGIELDKKHGISQRFTSFLNSTLQTIDNKIHATDAAKSVDQSYHVTDKLKETQNIITQYIENALDTPTGKRIRAFYQSGEKQVMDIHNEAKRLAEIKKQQGQGNTSNSPFQAPEKTTCSCGGDGGQCTCPPGKCACAGCDKPGTGANQTPLVGTTQGGDANRQFGSAVQDIKGAVQDIGTGASEKKL